MFKRRTRTYQDLVAEQVVQYESVEDIHDLPPIYHYWTNRYVLPKLRDVMGVTGVVEFYVAHIVERMSRAPGRCAHIISLGAGDSSLEVNIVQALLAAGARNFKLHCIELSPILIERAKARIAEAHVAEFISTREEDLNRWQGAHACTAVLANHVLHHVVELEFLFERISSTIGEVGVFLTADMIGRNGHMRWPEAMTLIASLWPALPERLRYNRISKKIDEQYSNVDCSVKGFEGIRAQDILPLLVKRFKFEKFLGFGNLPDIFIERLFGPNYDIERWADTEVVDKLEELNETLLELGALKPTMMFAVLSNCYGGTPRVWGTLTPAFSLRHERPQAAPGHHRPEKKFRFTAGDADCACLKSGWAPPETWGTWMTEDKADVEVALPPEFRAIAVEIMIDAIAFMPKECAQRDFIIELNGQRGGRVTFSRAEVRRPCILRVPAGQTERDCLNLAFRALDRASPAEDGSPDRRYLGLGLTRIRVRPAHA
jgi:2-polyprenyl-3-methyl-5-hydroxy-6-metoxy-1,4-benzoquinol methylase